MGSPWAPYGDELMRAFRKEELGDILNKLPSLSPDRITNLFLINDDEIIRSAVLKAIELHGVSSRCACTRLAGPRQLDHQQQLSQGESMCSRTVYRICAYLHAMMRTTMSDAHSHAPHVFLSLACRA